jgi:hypothetical protein
VLGVGHTPSTAQLRPSKSYRLRTGEGQVSTLGVGAPSPGEFGGKVGGKAAPDAQGSCRCLRRRGCFRSLPSFLKVDLSSVSLTVSRFVLVDFRYTSDPLGDVRLYEAGNTYDMSPALAHAAAKRDLVAAQRPIDWEPPSILRPPEVLTDAELAAR